MIYIRIIELISGEKPRIHLFGSNFFEGVLQMIKTKRTSDHDQLKDPPHRQFIKEFELQLNFLLWEQSIL